MHSFDLDRTGQLDTFELIFNAIQTFPENKIALVMKMLDEQLDSQPGSHLAYFRHLSAQSAFTWNMVEINHRSLRTSQLTASDYWINKEFEYVYAK
jgi:hypothetical protein